MQTGVLLVIFFGVRALAVSWHVDGARQPPVRLASLRTNHAQPRQVRRPRYRRRRCFDSEYAGAPPGSIPFGAWRRFGGSLGPISGPFDRGVVRRSEWQRR